MKCEKSLMAVPLVAFILVGATRMQPQSEAEKSPAKAHVSGAGMADPYTKKVKNTSFVAPSGERVLRHEVIVDATLEEVWEALTTAEGLKSFMAPTVDVELKTGGRFESNYKRGSKIGDPGTIHNIVLSYVPMEMFAIKVGLTEQFPPEPREAGTLFSVLTFKQLGPKRVEVTESMVGWKQGPEWDQTYGFFDQANAYTLGQLCKRFAVGPREWVAKK